MRPRAVFLERLRLHIKNLSRLAGDYDRGEVEQAILMSNSLRLLFNDTQSQTSLLKHLEVKDKIRLLSTVNPVSPTAGYWAGITTMRIWPQQEEAVFIPKRWTADRKQQVPFDAWWSTEVVYLDRASGWEVTRGDVVRSMANKDGGVHVDKNLDDKYEWVSEGTGWSINLNPDTGPSKTLPFEHAHLAAIRQITYEVLHSDNILKILSEGSC